MKTTKVTAMGILQVYCPRCERLQLSIHPGSSYQIQNPSQIPSCKVCLGINDITAKTNVNKSVTKKTEGKVIKQNNRKKYKKNRTLKS